MVTMFGWLTNSRDGVDRTCDHKRTEDEHELSCKRDAVVSVDGVKYCSVHAGKAPTTDR